MPAGTTLPTEKEEHCHTPNSPVASLSTSNWGINLSGQIMQGRNCDVNEMRRTVLHACLCVPLYLCISATVSNSLVVGWINLQNALNLGNVTCARNTVEVL